MGRVDLSTAKTVMLIRKTSKKSTASDFPCVKARLKIFFRFAIPFIFSYFFRFDKSAVF